MKSPRAFAIALVCAASASTIASAVDIGQGAPPFALPTASGDTISIERLRGKVVYVDFWASWCAPCRRSFPWMNAMNRKYGGAGLAIVAVNVDKKRDDATRFLTETPAEFTVVFDAQGDAPAAYAVKGMPSSYLIDRAGNVVAVEQGFKDASGALLEQKIHALLSPR